MSFKGIVLAGGSGTRLYPITRGVSKQLLAIYDKPMIYYPISILMTAEIKDILIITTPEDRQMFIRLLGDGSRFGVKFSYEIQHKPEGIAQAFLIGKKFIGNDNVALILGDNIFYGSDFKSMLKRAISIKNGATIFGCRVNDPERFGVIEFDKNGKVLSIEEKPKKPKSDYIVTGLYFYDNDVISISENIKPSKRNELEITSVNNEYLRRGNLNVKCFDNNYTWFDTGTCDSMLEASIFIRRMEKKNNSKIACLQEIAYNNGWINNSDIVNSIHGMINSEYGKYVLRIAGK